MKTDSVRQRWHSLGMIQCLLVAVVAMVTLSSSFRINHRDPRRITIHRGLFRRAQRPSSLTIQHAKRRRSTSTGDVEDVISAMPSNRSTGMTITPFSTESGELPDNKVVFPEVEQFGIDERAIRNSPVGKVVFGILERLFPVFQEPNWFDVYDPPITAKENLELPYFDGYDFANSSWTIYIRLKMGAWNWLDRLGLVPSPTQVCTYTYLDIY
jgi:hypothetical protein